MSRRRQRCAWDKKELCMGSASPSNLVTLSRQVRQVITFQAKLLPAMPNDSSSETELMVNRRPLKAASLSLAMGVSERKSRVNASLWSSVSMNDLMNYAIDMIALTLCCWCLLSPCLPLT